VGAAIKLLSPLEASARPTVDAQYTGSNLPTMTFVNAPPDRRSGETVWRTHPRIDRRGGRK
jgi:hypothetical protein